MKQKLLSLLTLLVLCVTGAWADKTYAPTPATARLVQDNVLITGTYASKKVANTSSVASFYVASGSYAPVSIISKVANIKSVTIRGNRDTGSNDNTVKAFNLLTSADLTTFATPTTGFTATKDNNGTETSVTSLSDIPMVGNNQSYATVVTVTFDTPVMGVELTYSNNTSFSSISVTYDDAITVASQLCEAHASSTTAYTGTDCTVTADGVQSGVTISSSYYYNKLSADAKYIQLDLGTGNTYQEGDEIWIECNGNGVRTEGVKLNSSASAEGAVAVVSVPTIGSGMPMWVRYVTTASSPWKDQQSLYVLRYSSNSRIQGISVHRGATELFIKTQPVSAGYLSGASATALTVEAQGGTSPYSYQWYSSTDAVKTSTTALTSAAEIAKGSQSASYTPSTTATGYYYCKVTDNASPTPAEVESNVATITISAATAPTISIESDADAAVDKGTVVTLTATATGVPTPTIQWYQNTVNNSTTGTPIAGATETTYQPSTTAGGTLYYYAIATNNYNDADHSATSNVVAVEVNRSSDAVLTKAQFSNGFFGEITQPSGSTHGAIKAWYIDGESAPTIASTTCSDGASIENDGSTLTVTAEDDVTTAIYDITATAVTPYTGVGEVVFDGEETWVRAPYGYLNSDESKKSKHGWGMVQPNTPERQYNGQSRVTLFLAPSTSVNLVSGIEANDRNINVYVNSTLVKPAVKLAKNGGTVDVTGDASNPYILIVEQSAAGGDAAIKSIEITPATDGATISASGYNTFSSSKPLDLSSITNGTAYVATGVTGGKVVLSKSTAIVPAGTGLFIAGTESEEFTINACYATPTLEGTNLFVGAPSGTTVEKAGDGEYNYVFGWTDAENPGFYLINGTAANLGAGKAYLHTTSALTVDTSARGGFIFEDEGETTGVVSVGKPQTAGNREVYNLNGQRVAQPAKGLYIVNGKKVIIK